MRIEKGLTRTVIVTEKYAIKIPSLSSWQLFIAGILSNIQERKFSKKKYPELLPVLFSDPFGFFVVMPKVDLYYTNYMPLNADLYLKTVLHDDYCIPAENKSGTFGIYKDKRVVIDYGVVPLLALPPNAVQKDFFKAQAERGKNEQSK